MTVKMMAPAVVWSMLRRDPSSGGEHRHTVVLGDPEVDANAAGDRRIQSVAEPSQEKEFRKETRVDASGPQCMTAIMKIMRPTSGQQYP